MHEQPKYFTLVISLRISRFTSDTLTCYKYSKPIDKYLTCSLSVHWYAVSPNDAS